jgi:hypothetical protein
MMSEKKLPLGLLVLTRTFSLGAGRQKNDYYLAKGLRLKYG